MSIANCWLEIRLFFSFFCLFFKAKFRSEFSSVCRRAKPNLSFSETRRTGRFASGTYTSCSPGGGGGGENINMTSVMSRSVRMSPVIRDKVSAYCDWPLQAASQAKLTTNCEQGRDERGTCWNFTWRNNICVCVNISCTSRWKLLY